jgi:hypothetical protein
MDLVHKMPFFLKVTIMTKLMFVYSVIVLAFLTSLLDV